MSPENQDSKSLNKHISETGICSRREADKMIKAGRVKINGVTAVLGNRVEEGDKVSIDGKLLHSKEKTIYLAFHKPVGITSTTDRKDKDNIIDFINYPKRIFPVGRLDKPSEGLIFLTNDGDIVNKILRAGNHHEKEYIVTVNKPITDDFIRKMGNGIPILDTVTKKCYVSKQSNYVFKIVLVQGLNRQIRRMCEYLGYEVIRLQRTRIMSIRLEGIAPGKWRYFTPKEIKTIQKLIADSIQTKDASI